LKNFFFLKIVIVEVTREETLQKAVRRYQSIFWTLDEAVHELTRTGEMKPFLKEWNKAAIDISKIHEELGIDQDESTTTLGFPLFSIRRKPVRTLQRLSLGGTFCTCPPSTKGSSIWSMAFLSLFDIEYEDCLRQQFVVHENHVYSSLILCIPMVADVWFRVFVVFGYVQDK
jgi:hypothetical protein